MSEWHDMFGDDNMDSSNEEKEDDDDEGEDKGTSNNRLSSSPFIIKQIPGIGGMRGMFAARDLPSGTLVLAECPLYTWKGYFSCQEVLRKTVTAVCSVKKIHDVTKALHPFRLEDADDEEISNMRELWGESLSLVITDMQSLHLDHDVDEILRVSLTLQHNAYGSGFYELFSLVNHSCVPNCTKLCPTTEKGWRHASELWTTRTVKKGEELTICYNHIREMVSQSIAKFLHDHHRFTCQCPVHITANVQTEEAHGDNWCVSLQDQIECYEDLLEGFDVSNAEKVNVTTIFDVITDCDEMLSDVSTLVNNDSSDLYTAIRELKSWSIALKDGNLSNFSHIERESTMSIEERDVLYLLVRLHKAIIRAAAVSIQALGCLENSLLLKKKTNKVCEVVDKLKWAAIKYLKHSLHVVPLQLSYLGRDHIDLAQTYLDISEGIRCLFSLENKAVTVDGEKSLFVSIFAHNRDAFHWTSSSKKILQKVMTNVRNEGERIAALYRPRYDLVQDRSANVSIQMPSVYEHVTVSN